MACDTDIKVVLSTVCKQLVSLAQVFLNKLFGKAGSQQCLIRWVSFCLLEPGHHFLQ